MAGKVKTLVNNYETKSYSKNCKTYSRFNLLEKQTTNKVKCWVLDRKEIEITKKPKSK